MADLVMVAVQIAVVAEVVVAAVVAQMNIWAVLRLWAVVVVGCYTLQGSGGRGWIVVVVCERTRLGCG